jgi:hypothetical protein
LGTDTAAAIQDELPIEEPETTATEADVVDALERRYSATAGNGRRYATAYGVRSRAGFDARRTADFVAMDLWPSGGLRLHGHEVKVSRSDWLRELKEPEKSAEFIPWMNCWWLVVSDSRIVRPGELPDGWGLLVMRGGALAVVQAAPKREARPLTPSRLAALLRAVAQTAEYRGRREADAAGLRAGASAGELAAALAKTRGNLVAEESRLRRARDEISEWKAAFAAAGGALACRHCGQPVVPRALGGGRFSRWRHRSSKHDAACAEIRAGVSRWAEIGPADDFEDAEAS